MHLVFDSKVPEAQFQVQITFPYHEQVLEKRHQQYRILNEVTGKNEMNAANWNECLELSLEQKEARAEKTFNAIMSRVMARETRERSSSSPRGGRNFIVENMIEQQRTYLPLEE